MSLQEKLKEVKQDELSRLIPKNVKIIGGSGRGIGSVGQRSGEIHALSPYLNR